MELVVAELKTESLYQEITPSKNTILRAIRPHLYIHNNPSGSLKLQILDQNNELIAESETLAISDITSALYFHGYVRFYVNLYMQKDISYRIKLVGSGYSFSENAYVGWCNGFDLNKFSLNYTPINSFEYPLDFETWIRNP